MRISVDLGIEPRYKKARESEQENQISGLPEQHKDKRLPLIRSGSVINLTEPPTLCYA